MKGFWKVTLVLMAAALLSGIVSTVWSSQITEGQVVNVEGWTLNIRTTSDESLSFNPRWVQSGQSWTPARPAFTILPALESGEVVRITWTMDENENRRRIDDIQVISAREGVTKGVVSTAAAAKLVIKPQDKPGTVTLNPKYVQVEGKWVPDPAVSSVLVRLAPNTPVTVHWAWDGEGRKRITSIAVN